MGNSISIFFLLLFHLFLLPQFTLSYSEQQNQNQVKDLWEDDPFHHIVNLDKKGDYVLEWAVNWSTRTVQFNATVRTKGYIGFGITSTGKMSGADLIMGGVNSATGEAYLLDMHVPNGTRKPILDTSQDYLLLSAWENGTHTSIVFSRELETCDGSNDHVIDDDTIKFIWSFGEKDDVSLYHYQNRGEYAVHMLYPDFTPRLIKEANRLNQTLTQKELGDDIKVWTLTRRQLLPPNETTYWCSFHKGPVLSRQHHMIGFNFRIENEIQERHTHHLVILKCTPPPGEDPNEFFQPYVQNQTGESCILLTTTFQEGANGGGGGDSPFGMPMQYCQEYTYVFGIGMEMFFLPNHVGLPFGDNPDEYYLLQVHYDNPHQRRDLEYDINIDIYYTNNLRENDAGIIGLGHRTPGSPSILLPPMSLNQTTYAHCGGDCSREILPPEGIHVFSAFQHTHYSGIRHRVRHFRGKEELPWIINDDNYSNLHQFQAHLRSEVKILPGDHLTAICVSDNSWMNGTAVTGGFATRQEMCTFNFYYYNKIYNRFNCRSHIDSPEYNWKHLGILGNLTWSEEDLEYVANQPENLAGMTISEIATNVVEWTEDKRNELQKDQREFPQWNFCPVSNPGMVGGGTGNQLKITGLPRGVKEWRRREEAEWKCAK